MAVTPTINITGEVSNVAMTASTTASVWIYPWTVSTTTSGIVSATVAGTDVSGKAYAGATSITFTIDNTAPTVTLTDTDSDNLVSGSSVVTITATFSEAMAVSSNDQHNRGGIQCSNDRFFNCRCLDLSMDGLHHY